MVVLEGKTLPGRSMSTVKEHYDNHLAQFYSWMIGDFEINRQDQEDFFVRQGISPGPSKLAIDLGSGPGIQSIALARLGFSVWAIDFNKTLCDELRRRKGNLNIEILEEDILDFSESIKDQVDLVVCMGDTLTHLPDSKTVYSLIKEISSVLTDDGKLILSFRDLSEELSGLQRFIPVRSDNDRIHTCFLEYFPHHVSVTDILHERIHGSWTLKASSYPKLRLPVELVRKYLTENHFRLMGVESIRGMHYWVAQVVR